MFLAVTAGSVENYDSRLVLVLADRGRQQKTEDGSESFLVLDKGYRVEGVPGTHNYQITHFEEYGARLEAKKEIVEDLETNALTTSALLSSTDPKLQAALQWRLSTPLMVLVVTLLAIPLSRTNPRQGKFAKLLPAIILYFCYLVSLNAMRGALESGSVPIEVTLLPVHLLFLGIALLLFRSGRLKKVVL